MRNTVIRASYQLVSNDQQLAEMVDVLSRSKQIGYDTEFVAEDCYQPDLCLVQLSTPDSVFVVDPRSCNELQPVWDLLTDPEKQVLVHAGREETLFVYRATGKSIPQLFDVQVAMGLLGGEYPASYGKLLQRLLGEVLSKGETRTDWRKRPLSNAQLDYAALDVLHLPQLVDILTEQLSEKGRLGWLEDELQRRQRQLILTQEQEGWYRLPAVQSLNGKQLGIVRELWHWRDNRARTKNMPSRRVLRDDLIIELARRGTPDAKKISQIRGLHHSGFQRFLPEIGECIKRGAQGPAPKIPWAPNSKKPKTPALLQQFLTAAMSYLCRSHQIAPAIVGTSDDVGRLAAFWLNGDKKRLTEEDAEYPNLLRGWRAEFVGKPLYEIFTGKKALKVNNPNQEMPLALCDVSRD